MMDIINPATEVVINSVAEDTIGQINQKYEAAKAAQPAWADVPVLNRIAVIARFQELLLENIDNLALTLTEEMGKPVWQAKNEINGASNRISFFLKNSEKYLADEVMVEEEGLKEILSYEPLGVIANISAWNYAYLVGVNVFVPALIAGNAVLYKPSEFTINTGLRIGALLHEAGVPKEVFSVVVGDRMAGDRLLDLPLDGYFFTGSVKTGKYIYNKVSPKMVPCQLELGGKDPMYVAEDIADVKTVAAAGVEGALYNNGQSCCAVERIYVHTDIYDEFVEEFVKEVANWKVGDPKDDKTMISALTRKDQVYVLEDQVQDALDKGAKVLTGGRWISGKGYYFEPTVLVNVNHTMKVMMDESFGPIIGIQKVANDAEAIALMKDTEFGLTSAVYTASKERAEKILKQMDSGTAYWNCCDRVSANLPWSGRRNSGFGATLSHLGIRAFTQPKGYHLRG